MVFVNVVVRNVKKNKLWVVLLMWVLVSNIITSAGERSKRKILRSTSSLPGAEPNLRHWFWFKASYFETGHFRKKQWAQTQKNMEKPLKNQQITTKENKTNVFLRGFPLFVPGLHGWKFCEASVGRVGPRPKPRYLVVFFRRKKNMFSN